MRILIFIAILLVSCVWEVPSYAQNIVNIQQLSFGEAVVRRNDSVYDIVVTPNGSKTAGANFEFLMPVKEGIYRLEGAAPLRPIVVNVTVDQQMIGGGQSFVIDNFNVDAPATTDSSGEAIINLGARLRTSATGMNYLGNADFNAVMTLSVTIL